MTYPLYSDQLAFLLTIFYMRLFLTIIGYIGSSQNLAAVTDIIAKLEDHGNPFFGMYRGSSSGHYSSIRLPRYLRSIEHFLVLDPVMGDNGQLYVQSDVIPLYKELMKFAKAITPNQFEAEYVLS